MLMKISLVGYDTLLIGNLLPVYLEELCACNLMVVQAFLDMLLQPR